MVDLKPDPQAAYAVIEGLWRLLDEIDTTGDMAKGDDAWYRKRVEFLQKQRWKIYNIDDPGSICKSEAARGEWQIGSVKNALSYLEDVPAPRSYEVANAMTILQDLLQKAQPPAQGGQE